MPVFTCPICLDTEAERADDHLGDWIHYCCPNCGDYRLSGTAAAVIKNLLTHDALKRASVRHSIRKMQVSAGRVEINSDLLSKLANLPLPDPFEQADNLVLWLGRNLEKPGDTIRLNTELAAAVLGTYEENGVIFILKGLADKGLIPAAGISAPRLEPISYPHTITLTFDGWERYYELTRRATQSRTAFMAMQFGDATLDNLVKSVLKPAVEQTGFKLMRLDDVPTAGLIDDRLRVEILRSHFLIADLTHGNAGAYWEAGYAEGLGKPVIYTCERKIFEEKKPHFDTNHHLTVRWDGCAPEAAAEELKATIRATLPTEAKLSDN